MMHLSEFLTAAQFKVSGGTEYCWECFGPNARFLDVAEDKAACIFDAVTQKVYAVEVFTETDQYRWVDPEYSPSFIAECVLRNVDYTIAFDSVRFTEISSITEILTLLSQVSVEQE